MKGRQKKASKGEVMKNEREDAKGNMRGEIECQRERERERERERGKINYESVMTVEKGRQMKLQRGDIFNFQVYLLQRAF